MRIDRPIFVKQNNTQDDISNIDSLISYGKHYVWQGSYMNMLLRELANE